MGEGEATTPVGTNKQLHLFYPETFPIKDNAQHSAQKRASKILGLPYVRGNHVRDHEQNHFFGCKSGRGFSRTTIASSTPSRKLTDVARCFCSTRLSGLAVLLRQKRSSWPKRWLGCTRKTLTAGAPRHHQEPKASQPQKSVELSRGRRTLCGRELKKRPHHVRRRRLS